MLFLLLNEKKYYSVNKRLGKKSNNLTNHRNFILYYVLQSQLFLYSRKLFSCSVVRSVGGSNPVLPLHFYRYHVPSLYKLTSLILQAIFLLFTGPLVYGNGQNIGMYKTWHLRNYFKRTFLLNMIFHFMYTYV